MFVMRSRFLINAIKISAICSSCESFAILKENHIGHTEFEMPIRCANEENKQKILGVSGWIWRYKFSTVSNGMHAFH